MGYEWEKRERRRRGGREQSEHWDRRGAIENTDWEGTRTRDPRSLSVPQMLSSITVALFSLQLTSGQQTSSSSVHHPPAFSHPFPPFSPLLLFFHTSAQPRLPSSLLPPKRHLIISPADQPGRPCLFACLGLLPRSLSPIALSHQRYLSPLRRREKAHFGPTSFSSFPSPFYPSRQDKTRDSLR